MLGKKINNTRIIPVSLKIVTVFTIFILVSNLTTNYVNLMFNRTLLMNQMRQLIAKDLKDTYAFCNTQYEIYKYNNDFESSIKGIEDKGLHDFNNKKTKSLLLGVQNDGKILFQSTKQQRLEKFTDLKALQTIKDNLSKKNINEGLVNFTVNNADYQGVYKYNQKWDVYLIRAEELNEFYSESRTIFTKVSFIIILISMICAFMGTLVLRFVLRYIKILTNEIMAMIKSTNLEKIDLSKAPNDDITFLGTAFNSLSNTVSNLVDIFKKFVNQDIVVKAYNEREVRLEGKQQDLTILFTDIKSFTFITEVLGSDIIKLLNLHYDKSIREIIQHDGVIGSIIGDALLAVFGVMDNSKSSNKSLQAILAAYELQELAHNLRIDMHHKKEELVSQNGALTEEEERVYKAVLLEIGVGIDGGEVFYGTIGSWVRMTNTVIGDNVNAASRLEGLTRIYKIPVICSDYVKNDIETNVPEKNIKFIEVDTVQVKGKTTGKKIYWPIPVENFNRGFQKNISLFSEGLTYYYKGQWKKAYKYFEACNLPVAEVFRDRTQNYECPKNWKGIWQMTTK